MLLNAGFLCLEIVGFFVFFFMQMAVRMYIHTYIHYLLSWFQLEQNMCSNECICEQYALACSTHSDCSSHSFHELYHGGMTA